MDIETGGASTNLEELIQRGIRTAREGNPQGARRMFEAVLAVNKREERAWLWLASLADTKVKTSISGNRSQAKPQK